MSTLTVFAMHLDPYVHINGICSIADEKLKRHKKRDRGSIIPCNHSLQSKVAQTNRLMNPPPKAVNQSIDRLKTEFLEAMSIIIIEFE